MNIGKAIKLCRKQKNWTLAELADKSNLSTSYISLLEQGKRDPNLSKLENIAKSLKIPLSVLLFLGTDKKEIESISPELAEKLSLTTLKLIEEL
jgi:transcriptional regulator with XRE-family HTH domain